MSKTSRFHKESGNTAIIALVVLALVAAGSFAFFKYKGNSLSGMGIESAAGDVAEGGDIASEIKPGNPIIAKVNGKNITRLDVLNFIQSLPPQTRQMPVEQLYPLALDQLVVTQVIVDNTKNVKLDSDPDVRKQLNEAKEQIVRNVYIQKEVENRITDARVKEAYDLYTKNFPNIQEMKARHILVKEEAKAKELITKLEGGADFAQLATENSVDGTAKNGGDVGYFAEKEVVPEFAKAAFGLDVGTYTKKPVKTQFGYHVIKSEEKRQRPVPTLEQATPFIKVQLRRAILEEMIRDWRQKANVEVFNINGEKIEQQSAPAAEAAPAAETAPAPAEAPAAPPAE